MRKQNPGIDAKVAEEAWRKMAQPVRADTEWRLKCVLATPMYGGGVHAGEVDKEMPIRVSAIRGQLRFWWRIASGPFVSSEEMFRRETSIWGGIADAGPTASRVILRLTDHDSPNPEPAHQYQDPNNPGKLKSFPRVAHWADAYALFSAQGKVSQDKRSMEEQPKKLAQPGLAFALSIRLDDRLTKEQRNEVQTALRWWASFGGLGARTRRGLGAVKIEAEGLTPVTRQEVERLGGRLCLLRSPNDSTQAWKKAVGLLKDFRQKPNVGRNPPADDPNCPGRSRWPEADTLRQLSKHAHPKHQQRIVQPDVFPRAAFGLPIVFHFKDAPRGNRPPHPHFDPDDHVLEPTDISSDEKRDRMASPLILRPYWNGKGWQPAALLLPGWEQALTQPLKFKGQSYEPKAWPTDPTRRHDLANQIRPMQGRSNDVLTAFMDFFAKGGR